MPNEFEDLKGPEEPNLFSHESEWDFSAYERYLLFLHERNFSDIVKLTNEENIAINIIPLYNTLYLLWKQLKSLFTHRKAITSFADREEEARAKGVPTTAFKEFVSQKMEEFKTSDLEAKKKIVEEIRHLDLSTRLYDALITELFEDVKKVVMKMYRSSSLTKDQVIQAFWELIDIYGYVREYKAMKGLGIKTRKVLSKRDILRAVSKPSV